MLRRDWRSLERQISTSPSREIGVSGDNMEVLIRLALAIGVSAALSSNATPSAPPLVCPAGAPIGNVDLRVRGAGSGGAGSARTAALPLKTLNRLEEGDVVIYSPVLRSNESRKGEVALVLVPVRPKEDEPLVVLDPKPAKAPQEWQIPARSSVAVFVYGPAGINRRKVRTFLSKDSDLVSQLADYAEKTAQTEALLTALAGDNATGDPVNAAFRGFASQGGASAIDRSLTPNQQMMLALKTLNPAVANYDPIAPQSSQRIGQTASLATSVAALFFGSPVGLAAGGTAMLLEMRSVVFPNTVFRSSFAQPVPGEALGLCGKRDAVPPHTKVAYLWATRIPNVGPPHLETEKPWTLPAGLKAALPLKASEGEWKYTDRTRDWALEPENALAKTTPVAVHPLPDSKTLEIDLAKATVPPGHYRLQAKWDWERFEIGGDITVAPLDDFSKAHLERDSQDRLVSKSGRDTVTVTGAEFQFVVKTELVKPGDRFFTPVAVPFALPRGFREGAQDRMDVQINTADLDPGDYHLLITQPDGKPHAVPLSVLGPAPKIDGLPIRTYRGDKPDRITLRGERLDRIAKLESNGASVELNPASADGRSRVAILRAASSGSERTYDLKLYVENRSEPLVAANALEIVGPRATIESARVSLPEQTSVTLNAGELPSSYLLTAILRVKDLRLQDALALECKGGTDSRLEMRIGDKTAAYRLEQLSSDSLFLTFDTGKFPNGCELSAGLSSSAESYSLGRVLRIPRIDSMTIAGELSPDAGNDGVDVILSGEDLQTIDRAGWDPEHGTSIDDLPATVPGSPEKQALDKQTLRLRLPSAPNSSDSSVYVWLRGETQGRATALKISASPRARQATQ